MVFLLLVLTTSMPRLGDIGKCDYFPLQCPVPALDGIFSDIILRLVLLELVQ